MKRHFSRTIVLLGLVMSLLLVACRQREATPTPLPIPTATAVEPTTDDATQLPVATDVPADEVDAPPTSASDGVDWPPQIVYSSPAPGEETLLDGAITVRFDQPMDQASVEAAFSVENSAESTPASGQFSWPQPDTLIFTPSQTYERKTTYRVKISPSAQAQTGLALLDALDLEFETVGYLDVAQVIPADDADAIQTDTAITVVFNRPVVPLVTTGQQADLPQPLTIEPATTGTGTWVSTSIYRFVPDAALAGATTYEITVAEGLTDVTSGVLDAAVSWSFQTVRPQVIDTTLAEVGEFIVPTEPISVTFNMPMAQASTEAAVALSPVAPVAFSWSEDGRTLILTPEQPLALGTTYALSISSNAQSATGEATLGNAFQTQFETVPFPGVEFVTPSPNDTEQRYGFYYYENIQITFASPMNLETVENQVTIDPAPLEDVEYYYSQDGRYVTLQVNLARNTTYTVSVPATAADPYGNTLGAPYTWSFSTPDYDPIASFNLPQTISQLSTSFPTDIDIVHRNVERFDLNLYTVPADSLVGLIVEPYIIQDGRVPGASLVRSWSLNVDDNDSTGTLGVSLADDEGALPTGFYFLELLVDGLPEYARYWQNQRHLMVVADTNLVVRENYDNVYVWATDLTSGTPRAGVAVTLYDRLGRELGRAETDSNGLVTFANEQSDYLQGVIAVSNAPGEAGFGVGRSEWNQSAESWQFGVEFGYEPASDNTLYLYTDRPIYRPGDTVNFRGIVRQPQYGRYASPTVEQVPLRVMNDRGDQLTTLRAPVDDNGNIAGDFTLPESASLGNYSIIVGGSSRWAYTSQRGFTVAEYRTPEVLVTVSAEPQQTVRGETVEITVQADYFFGASATDLTVNWSVNDAAYSLPWSGPYYSFTDDQYPFVYYEGPFGGPGYYGGYIAGGEGVTDGDGRFTVTLPADLLEKAPDGSRQVTIEASVVDVSQNFVVGRTSVVYHAADAYVGIRAQNYINSAGSEAAVSLITVDWDAEPQPNQSVEVVFYEREWVSARRETYGTYFTNWEPVDTEVARTTVTTDADGEATAAFTPTSGGSYVAKATLTDAAGRSHTSSTYMYVLDENYVAWRFNQRERRMDLVIDKDSYQVGDSAEILVQSPFEGPVQAWLAIERGDIIEQRIVTLQSSSDVLTLPITEAYAPNVFVTVVAIKPVDDSDRPWADIRLGLVELPVSNERLTLDITLTPAQEQYVPGDTASFNVQVRDWQGNPVQADVSMALVDRAVLTLRDDNAPDIRDAFYGAQPYRSQIGAGLFISGEGLNVELPIEPAGLGGGGGDGAFDVAQSVALRSDEGGDDDVRQDFRDTAYWEAVITTDDRGRATVEIPLPDNLTTWRLSSKGATAAETLVGQSFTDIVVTKPVLLRPITPRFFTVGDEMLLGTAINNNSGEELEAQVTLQTDDLLLLDSAEKTITLPPSGTTVVRWLVRVPDVLTADLTFRIEAGPYSDATKPTFGIAPDQHLPVYRYNGEDRTGTSGVLDTLGRRVEAILLPPTADTSLGDVQWQLSASLAASVVDSLEAFNDDPILVDCAYAAAERLLPNAVMAQALRDLDLDRPTLASTIEAQSKTDIGLIARAQLGGGGWGWCYDDSPDPVLSATIMLSVLKAQDAGYSVSQATIDRGVRYLRNRVAAPVEMGDRAGVNRQAFFLYVMSEAGEVDSAELDEFVAEHRATFDPYARAFLMLAYANGNAIGANVANLLADLNGDVIMSATGAHWEDAERDWFNLNSDVRGTAIVINALTRAEPDSALLPNAVRWLMTARTAQTWQTRYDTAWSLLALTDYMAATGELDAAYTYDVLLNGERVADGDFTPDSVLETNTFSVPLADLDADAVNYFDVRRTDGPGRLYYTAQLDSFISADGLPPVNRGIIVQRAYYDAACDADVCEPLTTFTPGQTVRVELTVIAPNDLLYLVVEDPLPSGAEAIDPNLNTTSSFAEAGVTRTASDYDYWGWWFFNRIEFRDERVVFSTEFLPAGTYRYAYTLNPTIPGTYQVMPTTARETFFPEVFGRSAGFLMTIESGE